MNRALVIPVALLVLSGCASVVRSTQLRPDYETTDKTRTTRVVIVVQPEPGQKPKVAQLWALMARRYVHLKRQYIVKAATTSAEPASALQAQQLCASTLATLEEGEKLEGVLWLEPTRLDGNAEGTEFVAGAKGKLLRCSDGEQVWSAEGEGSWRAGDQDTLQQSWNYAAELGAEVGPYVAPTWGLLRPILDTLPEVVLDEAAQEEKVLAE